MATENGPEANESLNWGRINVKTIILGPFSVQMALYGIWG